MVSCKCGAARGAPATARDGTARWRARFVRLMMVEQLTIAGEGTTCSVLYRSHDMITDPRDSMIVIYIVDWYRIRGIGFDSSRMRSVPCHSRGEIAA